MARRIKPDRQCYAVFFSALLTPLLQVGLSHTQLINNASANINPAMTNNAIPEMPRQCQTVNSVPPQPASQLKQEPTLLLPIADKETGNMVKPSPIEVSKAKPKPKKASHKSKPIVDDGPKVHASVKPLRMRIIGTQDGVAWIVNKEGDVVRVAVGDNVPGIGKIGVIRNDRTIKTDDGRQVLADAVN